MKLSRKAAGMTVAIAVAGGGIAYWFIDAIPQVRIVLPARGPAVQAVYATGNVEATFWAKVTPLERGQIEEVCACEGKQVKRGDVLAKLDDQELQAQLNQLKAREAFAADELRRYSKLLERKVVSTAAYEKVASERAQLLSSIAAANERLSHRVLRAPMGGIVLRRDGEVGEVVHPGDVLFWVGKPRPLRVTAEVDEEDIPLVRSGQRALIKADAFPEHVLEGKVGQITPKGDPTTKSYRVRIDLPDDTPLIIGMTTEINIIVKTVQDALLVPETAVVGSRVWMVVKRRAKARTVTTGIKGDSSIQIVSGLDEAEPIILEPSADIAEGKRLRVVEAQQEGE